MSAHYGMPKGYTLEYNGLQAQHRPTRINNYDPGIEISQGKISCLGQAVHLQNSPSHHSASSTRSPSTKSTQSAPIDTRTFFQGAFRYSIPANNNTPGNNDHIPQTNTVQEGAAGSAVYCPSSSVAPTNPSNDVEKIRAGISQMICSHRTPSEEKIMHSHKEKIATEKHNHESEQFSAHTSEDDCDAGEEEGHTSDSAQEQQAETSESISHTSIIRQWKKKKKRRRKKQKRLSIHKVVRQNGSPVKLQPIDLPVLTKKTSFKYSSKESSIPNPPLCARSMSVPKFETSPRKLSESIRIFCTGNTSRETNWNQQLPLPQRTTKIYLSDRQSNNMQELGQQFPCPPPCTPAPDVMLGIEFVNSMSDIRAQRTVKHRLEGMERAQQQQRQKQKEQQQQQLKVQQQQQLEQLRQRQRAEIYALNAVMTEQENANFKAFIKENGLNIGSKK